MDREKQVATATGRAAQRWMLTAVLSMMLVFGVAGALPAAPPSPGRVLLDLPTIEASARSLRARVLEAMAAVGGDPERQHVHLVVGFSTGHFALDPLAAEAARAIAWATIRDFLVQADRLSVYAWELEIWDHTGPSSNTDTVPEDHGVRKETLKGLFPLTTRAGSKGGHDTERALVYITERLGEASDAVIVLLANTAASIGTLDQKPIGENNDTYQRMLQKWKRLPAVNKSGASLELPYVEIHPTGGTITRGLDGIVVIPLSFRASPLGRALRSERLVSVPQAQATGRIGDRRSGGTPLLIVILVLIVATVYGVTRYVLGRGGLVRGSLVLEVGGRKFMISSVGIGDEICHIAGPNYPERSVETVFVPPDDGAPPLRLARLYRDRGGVRVEGDAFRLSQVDGNVVLNDWVLRPGKTHRLSISGEYEPDPAQPPRQVSLDLEASLHSSDRA